MGVVTWEDAGGRPGVLAAEVKSKTSMPTCLHAEIEKQAGEGRRPGHGLVSSEQYIGR